MTRSSATTVTTPVSLRQPSPALTVAAVVERDGRFLMVEEWVHGRRVLNQPAGHVEPGESLTEAVVREMMEETGWVFAPEAVTGIYLWDRPDRTKRFLRVAIRGRAIAHDTGRRLDNGIIQALWLTRAELVERGGALRSPMVMRAVDDHLAGADHSIVSLNSCTRQKLLQRAERL
ncbi:MAG: NUDIX hydrolase [Gammaproteobacteria bacterium]|nr:NUDIX hydrolase [Gammaproteobacteria bacterium]